MGKDLAERMVRWLKDHLRDSPWKVALEPEP